VSWEHPITVVFPVAQPDLLYFAVSSDPIKHHDSQLRGLRASRYDTK